MISPRKKSLFNLAGCCFKHGKHTRYAFCIVGPCELTRVTYMLYCVCDWQTVTHQRRRRMTCEAWCGGGEEEEESKWLLHEYHYFGEIVFYDHNATPFVDGFGNLEKKGRKEEKNQRECHHL